MRKSTIPNSIFGINSFLLIALVLGVFLRAIQYWANRSIWIDEAWITLNILNRDFGQLFLPLDYNQGAPIGFLLGEKLIISVLGYSEYALRLLPLLAGIGLLLIFYPLVRSFTSTFAAITAVFLLALAHFPIYYASEVKQYSSDAFVSGIILVMGIRLLNLRQISAKTSLALGLSSAVLLWCAHPAVFVLSAVFFALFVKYFRQKDKGSLAKLSIAGAFSLLSFLLFYFFSLTKLNASQDLNIFWDTQFHAFMPFPPKSSADIQLYMSTFLNIFNPTLSIGDRIPQLAGVTAFLSVVGGYSFFLLDGYKAILLIAPIGLTLLASVLHKYPFADRLLLFMAPLVIILIVQGLEFIRAHLNRQGRAIVIIIMLFFVFWEPATRATTLITYRQEAKPAFAYIQSHFILGDIIYINGASQFVFKYYEERYNFQDKKVIIGQYPETSDSLRADFADLRGHSRVWIVISNLTDAQFQPAMLNNNGTLLDTQLQKGVSLFLFDMNTQSGSNKSKNGGGGGSF